MRPKKILELVRYSTPVLDLVYEDQRTFLKDQGVEVLTVSLEKMSSKDRYKVLDACVHQTYDMLLLRGMEGLQEVVAHKGRRKMVVDHLSPFELTSDLRRAMWDVDAVFCYSETAREELAKMGAKRKARTFGGPWMSKFDCAPPNGPEIVFGLLPSCTQTKKVLRNILFTKERHQWEGKILTTSKVKHEDVEQVDDIYELVENCDVLLAPYEEMEFGQPHEGVILALSYGRALIATQTGAMEFSPYRSENYLMVPKYAPGAWGAAMRNYSKHRGKYDDFPDIARYDEEEVAKALLELVS